MRERRTNARGRTVELLAMLALGFACGSSSTLPPPCLYDGRHYVLGDSFPTVDGCATCSCTVGGVICGHATCPPDAGADTGGDARTRNDAQPPAPDAGPATCALDHTYRFRNDGGFVAYADSSTLAPPRTHAMARDYFRNAAPNTCMRDLPCSQMGAVDLDNIQQALAHPDVVTALGTTPRPFYGVDTRPSDGTVFIFDRDDQRGFSVGSGNVPPGVRALANLLSQLQRETAATQACAGL